MLKDTQIKTEENFYSNGKLEKKIVQNNAVKEITYYYSNGELYMRKLIDKKEEVEYIEYLSEEGEVLTKLKNFLNSGYELIYDILTKRYLKKKNGKLYYNGRLFWGKVKYYSEIYLVSETYNKLGNLVGISKLIHYDSGKILEIKNN